VIRAPEPSKRTGAHIYKSARHADERDDASGDSGTVRRGVFDCSSSAGERRTISLSDASKSFEPYARQEKCVRTDAPILRFRKDYFMKLKGPSSDGAKADFAA